MCSGARYPHISSVKVNIGKRQLNETRKPSLSSIAETRYSITTDTMTTPEFNIQLNVL